MPEFDYFIVFAEMRTGSNFLESNLNAFDGINCYGEAFNPHFIGYPNRTEVLGISQDQRESDPQSLIDTIRAGPGLGGFRFFNNHDPRVLDIALGDPRCAKIILTRNPIDSYVSWKIARATGQWKLTNVKHVRSEKAQFDSAEFAGHVAKLQEFQLLLLHKLQTSGQAPFYVAYDDLNDISVMNGIAKFLGVDERLDALDQKLKKQNPQPLSEKVKNFGEVERASADIDWFNLNRTPNFEPRRGPVVPSYAAAPESPLLFLPMKSGPESAVYDWLASVDSKTPNDLIRGFTQNTLRQWKRKHQGHRSFTVVRHPVARAHAAFCNVILPTGPGSFSEIRKTLRQRFDLPIPKEFPDPDYDTAQHRAAFLVFLKFLKANLSGQTGMRMDPHWLHQSTILEGYSQFACPDMIVREDRMEVDLTYIALSAGVLNPPPAPDLTDVHSELLSDIYDGEIEQIAHEIYQRDYLNFGFGGWRRA